MKKTGCSSRSFFFVFGESCFMKKKLILGLSLLVIGFIWSCQDNENPNVIEFYWEQTGCADPWAVNSNLSNKTLKSAVEEYLRNEGVVGARFTSIDVEWSGAVCLACHCKTGRWIYISAPLSQKEKLLELGFQQK